VIGFRPVVFIGSFDIVKDDIAAGFSPVRDVKIFAGVVPAEDFVYVLQTTFRPPFNGAALNRFEEVHLLIAVLEGALHK
jgi:hypothetical protein